MNLRKKYISIFGSYSIEDNIIIIICIVGLIRSLIGVVIDFDEFNLLFRSITFVLLFSGFLALIYWRSDLHWIKLAFGFVFIALMAVNFIQTGSLNGMGKFSAMGSLILLVVIYRGFWMLAMPSIYFILLAAITLYPEAFSFAGIEVIELTGDYRDDLNFWVSGIGIGVVVYYMKINYDIRQKRLTSVAELLNESNQLLISQQDKLATNRDELEKANDHLNSQIEKRTNELLNRTEALNSYVQLNTNEILQPLKETLEVIRHIQNTNSHDFHDSELVDLLKESGAELDGVHRVINESLISDGRVTRRHIKG